MVTFTATFDLTMAYLVAANLIAILVYVLILKHRTRRVQHALSDLTAVIMRYFRENGGDVKVECTSRPGGRSYTALISSGPMKRFRHSHVVEVILRDHVRKTCGLELEKVYWCFQIKPRTDASEPEAVGADAPAIGDATDEYREEGLARLADLPGYQVTEGSLEKYREVVEGRPRRADGARGWSKATAAAF